MPSHRADLDFDEKNSLYLGLTVVLVVLSLLGLAALFWLKSQPNVVTLISTPTPVIQSDIPNPFTRTPSDTPTASALPTSGSENVALPTDIPTLIPTPTPAFRQFTSEVYRFEITHSSGRKIYSNKESSGDRFTFASPQGNFAVHAGFSWSWLHPGRQFFEDYKVANQPTFVYEIPDQTIIDLEGNGFKYTLQCIHQGLSALKTECQDFINSFKLL